MKFLDIDASKCLRVEDFYDLLLHAIGAPDGHGNCTEAFLDSMVWGGMNSVEPPYTVRLSGTDGLPVDVKDAIDELTKALPNARLDHVKLRGSDVDVSIEVLS